MYAMRRDDLKTVVYNEEIQSQAEYFFCETEQELLYVLKDKVLYGIITKNDFINKKKQGKIINTEFKRLCSEQKTEEQLCTEAEGFFMRYKTIKELPVVDGRGILLYAYVRQGECLDVFPGRFRELYGNGRGFADYVECMEGRRVIEADHPEMLEQYLRLHGCQKEYEICKDSRKTKIGVEQLLQQYELEAFRKRLESIGENAVFLELPQQELLNSLSIEEKTRMYRSSENTLQYYLRNYEIDTDIQELARRVLGEDATKEFIESQDVPSQYILKDGVCYNSDFIGTYVNVVNGRRVTTDVRASVDGEIYLFGPCTVFGVIVEDRYTIASCLQRLLNESIWSREVINEGMVGTTFIEDVRKFNRCAYHRNALFVFFVRPGEEVQWIKSLVPDKRVYSLTECFNRFEFHDYFFDKPWHCNKKACAEMAKFIMELIEPILQNATLQEKKTMETVITLQSGLCEKEIQDYTENLKRHYRVGNNGAIVMNCNPFTKGHLYLIEQAACQVDNLYIFVVSEDKSKFLFEDRIRLVREGVKEKLDNVIVLPSGKLILSAGTFPEYFTKEDVSKDVILDTTFDLEIFARYIAPILNIKKRFAGEEPFDVVTRQYNRDMRRVLPQYGIDFVEIPRKLEGNEAISASRVRALLEEGAFEKIKAIVPEVTYCYLLEKFKSK